VFERFTDAARQGVVRGQEEAWSSEADAIQTEHLLLGLLEAGDELVVKALDGRGCPSVHHA
jgi:hypothetical protein